MRGLSWGITWSKHGHSRTVLNRRPLDPHTMPSASGWWGTTWGKEIRMSAHASSDRRSYFGRLGLVLSLIAALLFSAAPARA